jgi:hypothetical protein
METSFYSSDVLSDQQIRQALHIELMVALKLFNEVKGVFSDVLLLAQVDVFMIGLDVVEVALVLTYFLCYDTMQYNVNEVIMNVEQWRLLVE